MKEKSEKLSWSNDKKKVSDLVPWSKNPRRMTEKQVKDLQNSLEKFNLADPPIINSDGTIIGGHMRLKILGLLGRSEEMIDVRIPNRKLTEDEVKELNVRLNKNVAEWDYDLLSGFGDDFLKGVGFNDFELGNVVTPEDYSDMEKQLNDFGDIEEVMISVNVPKKYVEAVKSFLANGEPQNGVGFGRGVMKRCGLL